jgi:hypothetical protein
MTLRKLTIVPMLALAMFATGCGDDCESLCEDGQECEGVEKEDCAKNCEELEKLNEKAGCEDQYDDLVSCIADEDDICKVDENTCASEGGKYGECLLEYCTDHAEECD